MIETIKPLRPLPGKRKWVLTAETQLGLHFARAKVRVISSIQLAEAPDGKGGDIPQWLVSVSRLGKRPREADVAIVLDAFALKGAEEDNHHPGNARHFWLPVDPSRRVDCQCKVDEDVITEPDGYTYTSPKDGCSGCELELVFERAGMARPCPIHRKDGR